MSSCTSVHRDVRSHRENHSARCRASHAPQASPCDWEVTPSSFFMTLFDVLWYFTDLQRNEVLFVASVDEPTSITSVSMTIENVPDWSC